MTEDTITEDTIKTENKIKLIRKLGIVSFLILCIFGLLAIIFKSDYLTYIAIVLVIPIPILYTWQRIVEYKEEKRKKEISEK